MKLRDRIRELRRVRAGDLRPNPRNWRTHPENQENALRGILAEVGIADALLVQELADGSLMLIDGHLRADVAPETEWPVLVLDVTEEEADLLLAMVDPMAGLAEVNEEVLELLLAEIKTESDAVQAILNILAADNEIGDREANDPEAEWQGMPEYEMEDILGNALACLVRFKSEKDRSDFEILLGYKLQHKGNTYSTWFPKADFDQLGTKEGIVYGES